VLTEIPSTVNRNHVKRNYAVISANIWGATGETDVRVKKRTQPAEQPTGTVKITVNQGQGEQDRTGRDLDAVVRTLLLTLKAEAGWTDAQAAEWLGMPRNTLQTFLKGGGTSLKTLTNVCIALKMTPNRFFQDFADFAPETRATVLYAEDGVFDRFRTAMNVKQARELLEIIDHVNKHGDLSEFILGLKQVSGYKTTQPRAKKKRIAKSEK
jgi:DNA-binding Xre family transcriptional regulator